MGGLVSTDSRYDSSMSVDEEDHLFGTPTGASHLRGRRRSRSNAVRRNSHSSIDVDDRPVSVSNLAVPCGTRHPFADYRFGKKLGQGSFSVVYKGTSVYNEAVSVAIKEIRISEMTKDQRADIHTEMNILSQLRHPNIVRLSAVFQLPEKIFLIMEYLRGGELLKAICKRTLYEENDAKLIMIQLFQAVQYLHSRRVIHRDIKPQNIILETPDFHSRVKLVDFGFAVVIDDLGTAVQTKYTKGTPGYLAPEVLVQGEISSAVDIWGLGIVMYILLSGTKPFETHDKEAVVQCDINFESENWKLVSPSAKDLISLLLSKNPDDRPEAGEVLSHPWCAGFLCEQQSLLRQMSCPELTEQNRSDGVPIELPGGGAEAGTTPTSSCASSYEVSFNLLSQQILETLQRHPPAVPIQVKVPNNDPSPIGGDRADEDSDEDSPCVASSPMSSGGIPIPGSSTNNNSNNSNGNPIVARTRSSSLVLNSLLHPINESDRAEEDDKIPVSPRVSPRGSSSSLRRSLSKDVVNNNNNSNSINNSSTTELSSRRPLDNSTSGPPQLHHPRQLHPGLTSETESPPNGDLTVVLQGLQRAFGIRSVGLAVQGSIRFRRAGERRRSSPGVSSAHLEELAKLTSGVGNLSANCSPDDVASSLLTPSPHGSMMNGIGGGGGGGGSALSESARRSSVSAQMERRLLLHGSGQDSIGNNNNHKDNGVLGCDRTDSGEPR